jgi:hypothetical protein
LNVGNDVSCGNITISGGNVTATGGQGGSSNEYFGAGIGTGYSYAGSNACGNIIITGGTITANGAHSSAGIGNGYTGYNASSSCGYIKISGGTVTAKGGWDATGIGNGRTSTSGSCSCGYITIENTVTKVTAISGGNGAVSIGKHSHFNVGTCGTVTVGGTNYGTGISDSPFVYPQP